MVIRALDRVSPRVTVPVGVEPTMGKPRTRDPSDEQVPWYRETAYELEGASPSKSQADGARSVG